MSDAHVTWLREQIIERFRTAASVKEGFRHWRAGQPDEQGVVSVDAVNPPRANDPDIAAAAAGNGNNAAHIAMNDPESVMASCRAELDIVDKHTNTDALAPSGATVQICPTCRTSYPCPTIRSLHAGYCTRDGWQRW